MDDKRETVIDWVAIVAGLLAGVVVVSMAILFDLAF